MFSLSEDRATWKEFWLSCYFLELRYIQEMIIGHLAMAGIAKHTCFEKESLLFLSLAAFGPDFIDKPLHIFLRFPIHGVGHSLLFFSAVITAAWLLRIALRCNSRTIGAGMVMWGTHLVGDFLQLNALFWPFRGQWVQNSTFHFIERLWQFYVGRLYLAQFWMEIACVIILAVILLAKRFVTPLDQREALQLSGLPSSQHDLR